MGDQVIKHKAADLWKTVAVTLAGLVVGILTGAGPGYLHELPKRPTRAEVSDMIVKEAPATLKEELDKIITMQSDMNVQYTKLSVTLENIAEQLKSDNSNGRNRSR